MPRIVTRSTKPFDVARFLEEYGLQLPDEITLPLMHNAVQGVLPMTIDYSQYLAVEQDWKFTNFFGVLRLTAFPQFWDKVDPRVHDTEDYDEDDEYPNDGLSPDKEHTADLQIHRDYVADISK